MGVIYSRNGILYRNGGGDKNVSYENILGRDYRCYKINNTLWQTEYLDYIDANIEYRTNPNVSNSTASYYNNNESLNGYNGRKLGLLYNFSAKNYIAGLLDGTGWRLVTLNDLANIRAFYHNIPAITYLYIYLLGIAKTQELDWISNNWYGCGSGLCLKPNGNNSSVDSYKHYSDGAQFFGSGNIVFSFNINEISQSYFESTNRIMQRGLLFVKDIT